VKARANPATLSAVFVTAVVDEAARRGASRAALLRSAGLSEEAVVSPEALVPYPSVLSVWDTAMRSLRDDGLPVAVARTFKLEHYQVLGFAIMTAPSAREAIARVVRFAGLLSSAGHWTTEERDDVLHIRWHREGVRSLGHRAANESALAEFLHGTRQMLGTDVPASAVWFRHSAPRDTRAHRQHFGTTVHWDADEDALALPLAVLEAVPRFANPALAAHFEQRAAQLLSEVHEAETLVDRTRRIIAHSLPSGEPSTVAVAKQLGLSERTLRRALAAEGASFRGVVDGVRQERARILLEDRRTSIAEIALSLGFSELSAFSRAYRRWTGRPPSEARSSNVP
jgi:AraC-like DNA-binding protein